jgi:hypothetical protein
VQRLLIVHHTPSPHMQEMFEAVVSGATAPEIEGVQVGGMNLFQVVASYNETVSIGVTADRNALPDPSRYADCMQSAFEEMLSAAG